MTSSTSSLQVRAHCPLILITSAPVWLDQDLALLGLDDLADSVVSSSLIGIAKPDRGIYETAVERASVRAERCLFVDDRAENIEAAAALGMTTVLYRSVGDLQAALTPVLQTSPRN